MRVKGTLEGGALKQALAWLFDEAIFTSCKRHGNASWSFGALVTMALLWGWGDGGLRDRFGRGLEMLARLYRRRQWGMTYQGFLKLLGRWSGPLLSRMQARLRQRMQEVAADDWRIAGWVVLAADGTRVAAPRSEANHAWFSRPAPERKRLRKSSRRRRRRGRGKRQALLWGGLLTVPRGRPKVSLWSGPETSPQLVPHCWAGRETRPELCYRPARGSQKSYRGALACEFTQACSLACARLLMRSTALRSAANLGSRARLLPSPNPLPEGQGFLNRPSFPRALRGWKFWP